MQTDWTIHPYVGVGQLKFGMTPDEVAAILGPPEGSRPVASTGELRERREKSALQAVYAAGDRRLVELGFSPPIAGLEFDGVRLFTSPSHDALREILRRDPAPLADVGFVVFFDLGLSLTGFDDDDEDDKAVTVFDKGRWDEIRPQMQKFVFLAK